MVSNGFISWIFEFGDKVEELHPESLKKLFSVHAIKNNKKESTYDK